MIGVYLNEAEVVAVRDSEQSFFPWPLCSAVLWFDVLDSTFTYIAFCDKILHLSGYLHLQKTASPLL